ncbi:MAG: hypothetical protein R2860_11815 [Desulfobacterales bacterium]
MPETAYKQMMAPWVRPLPRSLRRSRRKPPLRRRSGPVLFDIYGTLFISASGDIGDFSTNPGPGNAYQGVAE